MDGKYARRVTGGVGSQVGHRRVWLGGGDGFGRAVGGGKSSLREEEEEKEKRRENYILVPSS